MIAAHQSPVVFCDANVLYGSLLRDLLMWLGVRRNLRLRWTVQVQEEWTRNLLAHRPDLLPEQLVRTCEQMNRAIPDALVPAGREEESYDLPDPADRHVLAAALACEAEVLLTFNIRDFPASAVPAELKVAHPDLYLTAYFQTHPQAVTAALRSLRANLKRPPLSVTEVVEALKKAGLPQLAGALQQAGSPF